MNKTTHILSITLLALTFFGANALAQTGRSNDPGTLRKVARLSSLTRLVAGRTARGTDSAVRERFELMNELAEKDPGQVLRHALSADALERAPEHLRHYFEKHEKLGGELEVIAECEEHHGRIERFLKFGDMRLPLFFATEPEGELLSGAKVTVNGLRIGDSIVAEADGMQAGVSTSDSKVVESSSLTSTTGERKVLVILVNFQDKQTQPFTLDHARNVTFNTTSSYFHENSYGQTWLTGDVYGWFTIPLSSTSCDTNAIATYAQQAATSAGVNLSAYGHYVYAFPRLSTCGFSGRGSVGGAPSHAWVNSDLMGHRVLGHELGHNFGLFHSRSMDCGPDVVDGNCTADEYGDVFDIMGASEPAHLNLFQKERLGWINSGGSPPLQTVTAAGTYFIDAYETPGSISKGLKILKSVSPTTGARTFYYIEHRTPTGFDSYLSNYGVQNGVVIHTGSDASGQETYLLDMTPATMNWYDSVLLSGQSFNDPAAGVTISTISADNSGAWVRVEMNAQPCVRSNPTVTVTPGQSSWLRAGSAYAYTVTIANNNSGGCGSENFDLGASLPAGWGVSYSTQSLNLSNGGSASATLNIASPVDAVDGRYNFGVSAVNASSGSHSGTSSGTYVIVSRLDMNAVPGSARYSRNQTATVTAAISAAGSPVAGISVIFTMTKPGGSVITQTVTSGSNGNAVFSYRFDRRRDPTGTYVVSASAAVKGVSGQATTSFLVNK